MSRQIFLCLLAWCLCLLCSQSKADLIVVSFGDLNWDRQLDPAGPAALNFSIASSGGAPSTNELNAFNLGLRIVPTAGAKGTLAIQSISAPVDNPVFTNFAANPSLVSLLDTQVISGENGPFANVTIPPSGRNLFTARFFAPNNDALGKFDIYFDRDTSNYFTTTAFDGFKFQNVDASVNANGFYAGSFNVTSVPEPSTITLTILGLSMWLGRRKRHRLKDRSNQTQGCFVWTLLWRDCLS